MSEPCSNGATCRVIGLSEYMCMCATGYDGGNCEDDIDVCEHTKPCMNNGTCHNTGPNAYECHCQEGYTGSDCHSKCFAIML